MEYLTILEDVKHNIIENSQLIKSLASDCGDDRFREEINNIIKNTINDRLKIVESIVVLKTKQKRIDSALERVINQADTADELNRKCKELLQNENKRINVKQSAEYVEFRKKMRHAIGDTEARNINDDDIAEVAEVGGNVVSMFDPWSKALMVNPVCNTKCGHHYEHDSVHALIKDNANIRCPIVGCVSKAFIKASDLEPDLELREKLTAHRAAQDLGESSSSEEDS